MCRLMLIIPITAARTKTTAMTIPAIRPGDMLDFEVAAGNEDCVGELAADKPVALVGGAEGEDVGSVEVVSAVADSSVLNFGSDGSASVVVSAELSAAVVSAVV